MNDLDCLADMLDRRVLIGKTTDVLRKTLTADPTEALGRAAQLIATPELIEQAARDAVGLASYLGIAHKEMAHAIGVSPTVWGEIARGTRTLTHDQAITVAKWVAARLSEMSPDRGNSTTTPARGQAAPAKDRATVS